MNSKIENRRNRRIPIKWPVVVMTSQGAVKGNTSNISVSGALILSMEAVEADDEFEVILKPDEDREIRVTCEKVWSAELKINVFVFKGIGVRFTKIDPDDYERIASLVAEHDA